MAHFKRTNFTGGKSFSYFFSNFNQAIENNTKKHLHNKIGSAKSTREKYFDTIFIQHCVC